MKIDDYFPQEEIGGWRRLVHEFHGKLLLDNDFPDSKALLICLYMCCNKNKKAEVSYSEVKNLFLEFGRNEQNFKANLHNARKQDLVNEKLEEKAKLLYLTIKGLKAVKDLVGDTVGVRTWVIEAGKVYSGKKLFQEVVLSSVGSSLKICDPYCGARTIDLLSGIGHNCRVMILTQSIETKGSFQRELEDFQKEYSGIDIEVRVFSASTLHDRYAISDDNCWSIGSSLKDLGNKDTIVTKLGDEIRYALEEMFEERWKRSSPLV